MKKILLYLSIFAVTACNAQLVVQKNNGWTLGGNTLTADTKIGSKNGWNMQFVSNNTLRATLLSNGHWDFVSNIYDSGDNLFLDIGNHALHNSSGIKTFSAENSAAFDQASGISANFDVRGFYDLAGDQMINYYSGFAKINGSNSVGDLAGFDNNDFIQFTEGSGTAGYGWYLKAHRDASGGGNDWPVVLKTLNAPTGGNYPILYLQPDFGRTIIGGDGIYSTDTVVINVASRTANSSTGKATFGFENGTIHNPVTGALRFDAANATINMGSDIRINYNGGYIYYQNTNLFCDWGNARFYNSNGSTKVFDFYDVNNLQIFPAGTGSVGIGTTTPTAKLQVVGLAEYADNAAAIADGLTAGAFYRTGDILKVVH